jgi:hypothetical protein
MIENETQLSIIMNYLLAYLVRSSFLLERLVWEGELLYCMHAGPVDG